jgi:general secretion pathway protein N
MRPHHSRIGLRIAVGASLLVLGDAATAPAQNADPVRPGNPLWAIPLKDLAATRERPVFSPSRRPPPPPVETAPPPYVPPPARPASPQLTLVGTVVSAIEEDDVVTTTDGLGIFLDEATKDIVRLKMGDDHNGWVLRSVQSRDATLQKDRKTVVLTLPARTTDQPAPRQTNLSAVRSLPPPPRDTRTLDERSPVYGD